MKTKHLFFDLDHTLWDFDANAKETLLELYALYRLDQFSDHSAQDFVRLYQRHNDALWDQYNRGQIKKEFLRTERFILTFKDMGYPEDSIPHDLWQQYLEICPTKTQLIPGCLNVLEQLNNHYQLHLITNGFAETQRRKLKHSGLGDFFQSLTISEEVGVQKPHPLIFQEALKSAGSAERHGVYVGDNFRADVQGGLNSGWRVFWYKPDNVLKPDEWQEHDQLVRIQHLEELLTHF